MDLSMKYYFWEPWHPKYSVLQEAFLLIVIGFLRSCLVIFFEMAWESPASK